MKKLINKIILLFLLPLSLFSPTLLAFPPKSRSSSDLIFMRKVPKCTEQQIDDIEKKFKIKVSELIKKIYLYDTDIRDMCFVATGGQYLSSEIVVDEIFPLGMVDEGSLRPTKDAFWFGYVKDSSSAMLYIDNKYIWYCEYDEKIPFKLCK